MLDDLFPSITEADEETRLKLAELLENRNEYLQQQLTLNSLRVTMLRDGTPESEQRAKDFSSTVVAPLREKMTPQIIELLQSSFDIKGIKGLMPIIVMGILQSVNLPVLLTTLGLEPDQVEQLASLVQDYVKKGK
jgi:hypothetical protein